MIKDCAMGRLSWIVGMGLMEPQDPPKRNLEAQIEREDVRIETEARVREDAMLLVLKTWDRAPSHADPSELEKARK